MRKNNKTNRWDVQRGVYAFPMGKARRELK